MANILVVDDEHGIRDLLSEILNDEGHSVELAENAAQARMARQRACPDLVLLDIWMPDTDGVSLLKEWASASLLTMPVIMMSGHATIDTAVEATRIGAQSFLEKPITLQKLLKAVSQALVVVPPPARKPALPGGLMMGGRTTDLVRTDITTQLPPSSSAHLPAGGDAMASGSVPGVPVDGPRAEQAFDLDKPLRHARDEFEKAYFEFHLAQENGSMTRVAEKTGLERTHLYRKLKQLGVDLGRGKKGAGG